ncbi:MAG: protein-L-isoaspartate O-methyltransferase [Phototrophicales bacterium]|nr:MAG: protein-L-isoaspartate O-methyltransferase [Phototrophicales bacterium]RMG75883.1 MAG: protein-L-isoaspartate(D-aspartate) O-methyltransferase [Chloroflexota bacterium]
MVDFAALRQKMVDEQLKARDIRDMRVLQAMNHVPRHEFVPPELQHLAYQDKPLPIGENQTISQPYIVALMTQMLQLEGHERVLEIGTGCGYQTAVLCELAAYVYSLERFALLADRASTTLARLGYDNLDIHVGDGSQGLPDMEPFDAIIVTAAAPSIPGPLVSQLSPNQGRLVVPVGDSKGQHIYIVQRIGDKNKVKRTIPVRFVPLIGRFGFRDDGNPPPATV